MIGLWYWCTDQYIVQRALGAPNEQTARRGSIFAGFLKLFPVYLFIIPGLDLLRPGPADKVPALAPIVGPRRQGHRRTGPGGVPADGRELLAARASAASSWPACSPR